MTLEITSHKHPLESADANILLQTKRTETNQATSCFAELNASGASSTGVCSTFTPKILVVEDNKLCRSIFANFLNTGGYEDVVLAEDADIAYDIMKNAVTPFDIVFTDHTMPSKLTGETLSEKIKSIYKTTIVISISSNADHWFKARPDLFNGAVPKPFSKNLVLTTLKKYFP